MTNRAKVRGWRAVTVGAVAGVLLVGSPMIPVATAGPATVRTPSAAVGNTYGGLTSQGMPVFVELTATRRQVVRAVGAVVMDCTAGGTWTVPDPFGKMPVTRAGRFRTVYGPFTQRNDDGTTTDFQGRMTGALNATKTAITGTWRMIATEHDGTGAVVDTCDTGLLTWRAKQ